MARVRPRRSAGPSTPPSCAHPAPPLCCGRLRSQGPPPSSSSFLRGAAAPFLPQPVRPRRWADPAALAGPPSLPSPPAALTGRAPPRVPQPRSAPRAAPRAPCPRSGGIRSDAPRTRRRKKRRGQPQAQGRKSGAGSVVWVGDLGLEIATFGSALEEPVCSVLFAPMAVGKEPRDTVSVDQETGQSSHRHREGSMQLPDFTHLR